MYLFKQIAITTKKHFGMFVISAAPDLPGFPLNDGEECCEAIHILCDDATRWAQRQCTDQPPASNPPELEQADVAPSVQWYTMG